MTSSCATRSKNRLDVDELRKMPVATPSGTAVPLAKHRRHRDWTRAGGHLTLGPGTDYQAHSLLAG